MEENLRSGLLLVIIAVFFIFFNSDLLVAQDDQSRNNYIGDWEDPGTWQIGDGIIANNNLMNIYGYVTRNSSLTINNNVELHIYDTLVIYGDLTIGNNGDFFVETQALVIVYGDVNLNNNVEIDLLSYFVVSGDLTQANNSGITSPGGDTLLYVTGSTSCNPARSTCLSSDEIGDEEGLLNNPEIADFILSTSSEILPSNPVLCTDSFIDLSVRSDGNNYQWYRNNIAIPGATSSTYSVSQTGNYDVSFILEGITINRTDDPVEVTVTAGSSPVIYYISSNSPVQVGNTVNLQLNAGSPWPSVVTGFNWTGPGNFTSTNEDPGFLASSLDNSGYYTVTVINNNGCTVVDSTNVNVYEVPSACCSGFSYYSRDNYSGNWSDGLSWGSPNDGWRPLPPPTGPMNTQSLCINGYITVNGDLTINGGTQKICDTLIITGDLNLSSYSFTVEPDGVLIVLGNFTGVNGSLPNNGRIVVVGEVYNPYSSSISGNGDIYIFDDTPFIQGFTPTGNDSTLAAKDSDLNTFVASIMCGTGISGGEINTNQTLCAGDDVASFNSITAASPGTFSYQWYQSVNSDDPATGTWSLITGESGLTYDHGEIFQTTYFYRKASKGSGCNVNSNVITVTVIPNPTTGNIYHKPND